MNRRTKITSSTLRTAKLMVMKICRHYSVCCQSNVTWPWSSLSPIGEFGECGDSSPHGSESGDESPHSIFSGLNDDQSHVRLIVSEAGANLASALSMQRHLSEQNDNCICFS